MKCEECKWWEESEDGGGECHGVPPHPRYGYAMTRSHDWCSLFRPKSWTHDPPKETRDSWHDDHTPTQRLEHGSV